MENITYLVANFNNGQYLEDCLDSLLEQTISRWNCIICDDCSTDNSISVIKPYLSERIRLIRNQKNIGYTETLKKLIEKSQTDIVGILDSDDALYCSATMEVLKVYDNKKEAGFVYSRFDAYDEELKEYLRSHGTKIKDGKTTLDSGYVSHLKTFRKIFYYKTQGYDNKFLYSEDRDIIYKLEEVTKPILIESSIYKYRIHSNSVSNKPGSQKIMQSNHYYSFIETLKRRDIRGIEYSLYKYDFYFMLLGKNKDYILPIRAIAIIFRKFLKKIDFYFKIKTGGRLRREDVNV